MKPDRLDKAALKLIRETGSLKRPKGYGGLWTADGKAPSDENPAVHGATVRKMLGAGLIRQGADRDEVLLLDLEG